MEREEINKEIDWLMGSIKRSCTQLKTEFIIIMIAVIIGVVIGGFYTVFGGNYSLIGMSVLLLFLGLLAILVVSFVAHKRLVRAETPQEMLAIYDRMWIIRSALWVALIGGSFFFVDGSLFSKICLMLAIALLAVTNWLDMNNKLRPWVGIVLLLVESVLLYYSQVGLLAGLLVLLLMLLIIAGQKMLLVFGPNHSGDDMVVQTEMEIKKLRELVKRIE